jgi:hypothetical protein
MRGGALPPALLCAALGFALAFAPRRVILPCLLGLIAPAAAIGRLNIDSTWTDTAFMGCWITVVITAASVHLPRGLGPRVALVLALNTGVWAGAVIAVAGAPLDLAKSLPWALLCLPGCWLVNTGRSVAIKVASSWLIAIALLVAFLPITTPTPGYVPDHMD